MPVEIRSSTDLKPGDLYEDCVYHPCVCLGIGEDGEVWGVSLVDGSHPRSCDVAHCGVRKLTPAEAWRWKQAGPEDVSLNPEDRWWGAGRLFGPPSPDAEYEVVFGSDVQRDGVFLELDRIEGASHETLAEVFQSDVDGTNYFTPYSTTAVPFAVLEDFVQRARDELSRRG